MTPEVATNLTFNLNDNKGRLVDQIKTRNDVPVNMIFILKMSNNVEPESLNEFDNCSVSYSFSNPQPRL